MMYASLLLSKQIIMSFFSQNEEYEFYIGLNEWSGLKKRAVMIFRLMTDIDSPSEIIITFGKFSFRKILSRSINLK